MLRFHYYFKDYHHEVKAFECLESAVNYVFDNAAHFSNFSLFKDDLVQIADDEGYILAIVDLGAMSVYAGKY